MAGTKRALRGRAIVRDGIIIGWRVYRLRPRSPIFGRSFAGYMWGAS